MMKRSAGFTLIGVLIAVAVIGFVAVGMASLYGSMTQAIGRNNVNAAADNFARYVQGLLDQPGVCSQALVAAGGGKPVWAPPFTTGVAIHHIQIGATAAIGPVPYIVNGHDPLIMAGNNSPGQIKLTAITLRQPQPAPANLPVITFEPNPVVQYSVPVQGSNTLYTVTSAVVELDLKYTGAFGGGDLAPRLISLMVAVDPATNQVAFCYQDQLVTALNATCSAANIYPGDGIYPALHGCPGTFPPTCARLHYLVGYDDQGVAMCNCVPSCSSGP